MFRFIIFIIGIIISVWVGTEVYEPVDRFVDGAEKSYLKFRAVEETISEGTTGFLDSVSDKYNEFLRLVGKEVAEEEVKKDIIEEEDDYFLETVFTYDIAKWVSIAVGVLTLSIYFNIISFLGFLLKPFFFLVPKKK